MSAAPHVILVGALPPPVHGMAAVNEAIHRELRKHGAKIILIDVSAHSLQRSLGMRLTRLPRVLSGLARLLACPARHGDVLYMSVSGGLGQVYEIAFLALARMRALRIYLHYHSFAYLDRRNLITAALIRMSGPAAVHVTLSPGMADRLRSRYPAAGRVVSISNAVFFTEDEAPGTARSRLRTIGFISNISAEKGIFEFLEVVAAYEARGLPLRAMIAGPFQDERTERTVRERLATLGTAEYVGSRYGRDKDLFLSSIDALVFPTRYVNEAEPLTLHEALRRHIPVIAYGRGAVPEVVDASCGRVIPPGDRFLPAALSQLESWSASDERYQAASRAAFACFSRTLDKNLRHWQELVGGVLEPADTAEHAAGVSPAALLARSRKLVQILLTGDRVWLKALRYGVGAGTEHLRVLRRLECRTIIDIGANRGQFALAARRCFPGARLVSFEPLPGPADVYRRIFAGDASALLHAAAIGPERGRFLIHVSEKDDSSSLLPPTALQRQLFPGTREVASVPVEVGPLERYLTGGEISTPALLKLDVQGFELKALQGCESLFDRLNYIYVECSFIELYENQPLVHEIIHYLDYHGFSLSGVYNMHYDHRGAGVQADFLFAKLPARDN